MTSTGSGLSVPDWPLSYGKFFPPMIGGIRFEHSHRVIAGVVGILTLGLMICFLIYEKRKWVKWIGVLAFLMVVAQAVLGGITVIYLLPTWVSIAHACLAQTFFCVIAALALFTSHEWKKDSTYESLHANSLKRLLLTTFVFVYLQLLLGAVVRHTHGQAINYHLIFAFLIAVHVLSTLLKVAALEGESRIKLLPHAVYLGFLLIFQVFLGLGAFIFKIALPAQELPRPNEVMITTAHQATGALILMTIFLLTLRGFRLLRAPVNSAKESIESLRGKPSSYLELTKPRLTLLALATTLLGFLLAVETRVPWMLLIHTLFGTALVGGGANAFNQYLEKEIDAKMKRTQNRPIPSGKLKPRDVLLFGLAVSSLGVLHLFLFVNFLTGFLGLAVLVTYVLIYTPLKRKTTLNTFVGAITGALPILIGWAASHGTLTNEAWALFLILFVWQLPHFLAIAWVYKEDYLNSGLRMLTLKDREGRQTAWRITFYSLLLILVSLAPVWMGMASATYFFGAAFLGMLFLGFAIFLTISRMVYAKKFVNASIAYLVFLMIFMMIDKG